VVEEIAEHAAGAKSSEASTDYNRVHTGHRVTFFNSSDLRLYTAQF
jgi:hypothetical protein